MPTYATAVMNYDRYNRMEKEARIRFDNTFGAHVTDNTNLQVSDLQLMQYIYSIANKKEKDELQRLYKQRGGFSINMFQAALVNNPAFKDHLVPMISQAALQETREPGSTYIYRNKSMSGMLKTQQQIYAKDMPFHNPQLSLRTPVLRNVIQGIAVPKTQRIITQPAPELTFKNLMRPWQQGDIKYDRTFDVYTTENPNEEVSDLQLMQHIYHIATPEEKEELKRLYKERGGFSVPMLQAYLVENPKFRDNLIKKISDAAMRHTLKGDSYIYKNPGMQGVLETQQKIYAQKMKLGPEWQLEIPVVKNFTQYFTNEITKNTFQNPNTKDGLTPENLMRVWDPGDSYDPLPKEHRGGGDMRYVAPAMAVGAPLALLGGMKGGVGLGLSLLGIAGAAGYGYGYAKTRGWKGWDWADKGTDALYNTFNKKQQKETEKSPAAPKVPKKP